MSCKTPWDWTSRGSHVYPWSQHQVKWLWRRKPSGGSCWKLMRYHEWPWKLWESQLGPNATWIFSLSLSIYISIYIYTQWCLSKTLSPYVSKKTISRVLHISRDFLRMLADSTHIWMHRTRPWPTGPPSWRPVDPAVNCWHASYLLRALRCGVLGWLRFPGVGEGHNLRNMMGPYVGGSE